MLMIVWNIYMIFICCLIKINCKTYFSKVMYLNNFLVDTIDCFGSPEKPYTFEGALVSHTRARERILCFFQPTKPTQYISVFAKKLDISQFGENCPTLSINEYSSVREELIDDFDLRIPMLVPSDPKLIVSSIFKMFYV